jgi:serine/threonine protein kinase
MEKIGRYEIKAIIGKGGMGTVYRALDPVLGRYVALKAITLEDSGVDLTKNQGIARGLAEARLSSQLIHPNIVITYDAGFERNVFFMALEYIDGVGLHSRVKQGPMEPVQAAEIVFNVCHALHYIHGKGLVHLDVKPANIMLTRIGEVKLMDFGIARVLNSKKSSDECSGSVPYMSPEQTGANYASDHRSDIFSLGVVLYELLSGKRPFPGENAFQIIYNILNSPHPPLEDSVPGLPEELIDVMDKALGKKPDDRFNTAKDFADALVPVLKGKTSKALSHEDKRKIDILRRLTFFQHFQNDHMERVLNISGWHIHKKGAYIIEPCEHDSHVYILVSGRASLVVKEAVSDTFSPGECFGESSILFQKPRQVSVRAETDCLVMSVNAHILNQEDPGLQVMFLKEFYRKKTRQLVHSNLKLIQGG